MIDDHGAVPPEWLAAVVIEASTARPDLRVVGYGLVAPGIIDVAAGVVRVAPNVGWRDVPIRRVLDSETGLPGAIGHDVRAGGLAEWRLGRGVGHDNLLFLALGTGIAGASIVDGRMLEADGYAGEIGHLHVSVRRPALRLRGVRVPGDDRLGRRGRPQLPAHGRAAASAPRRWPSWPGGVTRRPCRRSPWRWPGLSEALAAYAALLAPELVIIGGGLSGAADLIMDELAPALDDRLSFHRRPRLVTATLGSDAGVRGAGLLGWDHLIDEGIA